MVILVLGVIKVMANPFRTNIYYIFLCVDITGLKSTYVLTACPFQVLDASALDTRRGRPRNPLITDSPLTSSTTLSLFSKKNKKINVTRDM